VLLLSVAPLHQTQTNDGNETSFLYFLADKLSKFFEIEYQSVRQDYGADFFDWSKLKVSRIKGTKTRALFGPMTARGAIDNSFTFMGNMYKKQGGEYRLQPFKLPPQSFCDALNNDPYFMPEIAKVSNLTLPIPCPWDGTTYYIDGYQVTLPSALAFAAQSGDYALESVLVDKNNKMVFKVWAYYGILKV
jgi:hypothetical protein